MTDKAERLAINTNTAGISVGTFPARFRGQMFGDTSWLSTLTLRESSDGRALPVTVAGATGTAGPVNEWGDAFSETGEGALRARKDTAYSGVKYGVHDAKYQVQVSFEQARDDENFEGSLMARSSYMLRLFLSWRAAVGSGTNQGRGVFTALSGNADRHEDFTGADPTLDELEQIRYDGVDSAYSTHPSCSWIASAPSLRILAKIDNHGESLLKFDNLPQGAEARMLGKPVYVVPGVNTFAANADGVLGFGAWECMGLRLVGPLRIDESAVIDMDKDLVRFRMSSGYDLQLEDPAGVIVSDSGS